MTEILNINCLNADLIKLKNITSPKRKKSKLIDFSNVIIKKPWGYEYLIYQTDKVAITILFIKKGHKTSMHCHLNKKTSLIVLDGIINLKTLNTEYSLDYGKCAVIDKKKFHQSIAKTKDVILMEIETPNDKRDLYRLKDDYGRDNQGYESVKNIENKENFNYIISGSENTFHNKIKKFTNLAVGFYNYENLKLIFKENFSEKEKVSILNGHIEINNNIFSIGDTIQLTKITDKKSQIFISKDIQAVITLQNYSKTKISDYLIEYFINSGLNNFFGSVGNNNLHLIDSIAKKEEIELKLYSNSYVATMASLGFAKLSNQTPIVILSSGKSSIESIEAVINSYIERENIIVLCGYSRNKTSNYKNISNENEIDISNLLKKFTNFSYKITKESEINLVLKKIINYNNKQFKGPIWIDIPIDILGKVNVNSAKTKITIRKKFQKYKVTDKQNIQINKILDIINKSKKPVFLFGYGSNNPLVKNELKKFMGKFKIPLLFSKKSIGMLESNSLYNFGRPGASGNRYSNFIIQNCDLIIGVGTNFSEDITGKNLSLFSPNSKKISINLDKLSKKKESFYDLKMNIDSLVFLEKLMDKSKSIKKFDKWIKECRKLKRVFSFNFEGYFHGTNINPYIFINKLSKKIRPKSAIFYDGGLVSNYMQQGFETKKNQKLISFSSIDEGLALPSSLGYSGNNFEKLICICGDNNILEIISDFSFFNKMSTPVSIFCLTGIQNNYIRQIQNQFFGKRFIGTKSMGEIINKSQTNKFLKLNYLLKQLEFNYFEISNSKNLDNNIISLINNKKSNFCLVNIDKEHLVKPIIGFNLDFNGNWLQRPIEDMFPFIDRKILKKYKGY